MRAGNEVVVSQDTYGLHDSASHKTEETALRTTAESRDLILIREKGNPTKVTSTTKPKSREQKDEEKTVLHLEIHVLATNAS